MSTTKKLTNITTQQIAARGVQALGDRPNNLNQYGVGGLSANSLKLWFDKLATFIAGKINDLQDALSGEEAASYIRILLDDFEIENLQDLIVSFQNGVFAESILQCYIEGSNGLLPLKTVIDNIMRNASASEDEIESIWKSCAAEIGHSTVSDGFFDIVLKNYEGTIVSRTPIKYTVDTDRIEDRAVTNDKIAEGAITGEKLADDSVMNHNIMDDSVTEYKIARGAVTTDKLADCSVNRDKIDTFAIDEQKIAKDAVTTEALKNGAVTREKIGDDAVDYQKIAEGAVIREKIANGSVSAEKLAAGSVNETKLSSALQNRILTLEREAFTSIAYDPTTGKLTFTAIDGSTESVDLPLELIISGGYYDGEKGKEAIVLELANGDGDIRIPVDSMLSGVIDYIEGIKDSIYSFQQAPPLSALSEAILLPTPTLAQLAGLTN